jgi:thioredoxin reductase (NADPH)
VTKVDFSHGPFRIWVDDTEYTARTVIIATGASARWLGLESEERLKGRGVSACATCDGAFFRDKHIFVVGGGDSAFEEALFLTRFGYKVTLVHRRDEFRASPIMVDRARAHEKIEFKTPFAVEEVLGDDSISGLRLRNVETGETEEVEAGALFVAIGHDPEHRALRRPARPRRERLPHHEAGSTETNVPGVFAVGDVQDHIYRQAVTAAGSGCMGALDAERFLAAEEGHIETALTAAAAPRRADEGLAPRGEVRAAYGRNWIDLLDPNADELRQKAPRELEETAIEQLLAPPEHEDEPRPTLQGHGDYVFGVFLIAVSCREDDSVYYQEIDVVLTHDTLLTVRKTPPERRPAVRLRDRQADAEARRLRRDCSRTA